MGVKKMSNDKSRLISTLADLPSELTNMAVELSTLDKDVERKTIELEQLKISAEKLRRNLHQKEIYLTHVKEIYRLAKYQFTRLRMQTNMELSSADVVELEKWIGRVKNEDGFTTIKQAIRELDKYSPSEIKSNLYALVQKIIIEGPYSKKG